jgi:hypothetical protein
VIRHYLPCPPPASEKAIEEVCVLSDEACEAMDDSGSHIRTESGFITFDPVPLSGPQRIERRKQEEAIRAGTPAGMDTWFGSLELV